jgi:rubredoxin---NAD+ reductase
VGKADFEPYTPPAAGATSPRVARAAAAGTVRRSGQGLLIIGAGRAGWQVAQTLREHDANLPITLVSACAGDVYDKPMLSVAVARGLDPAHLVRECAADAAARLNVRLLCDTQAVAIDAPRRRLRTTRGTLRYGHLVLAHGAAPALPAVLPARHVWRVNDLAAYRKLRAALEGGAQRVAIVGAGLVGCELANDLALAGHHILLLDVQDRPLAAQLPAQASPRLLQAWQALPISFIGGVQVTGVARPPEGAAAPASLHVALRDGRVLDVDHVVAATGLRAPSRLAASAGLAYDVAAGGIVVDALSGATSQPGIYALGDCVVVQGQASRYIEPIARQAQGIVGDITAAANGKRSANIGATSAARPHAPVLRVKTSALPITVTGTLQGTGRWMALADNADELRLQRVGADGEVGATLVARPPQTQARSAEA